jgi:hypothetical protein
MLKFWQGLNPKVQNHVACLTSDCHLDESPKQWYNMAILCDENRIINEAFRTLSRIAQPVQALPHGGGVLQRPLPHVTTFQTTGS